MTVIVLLADGVRPDTLRAAIDAGTLPAMARLRSEHGGGLHEVTSTFPSVTGPAYTPFLMGRFPGPIGLPGLRWFDRERETCTFPDYTHPRLTAADGYLVDRYPCLLVSRCSTAYGGPVNCDATQAAGGDTALVRCGGAPGAKYGFVDVAATDVPGAEVFVSWEHEVLDLMLLDDVDFLRR